MKYLWNELMREANWIKLTEKKNAEISNCTDCKIFPCKLEILRLQIATGAEKWSFFFTKAAKLFRQDQWHVTKCGGSWMYKKCIKLLTDRLVNWIETCDSVGHEIVSQERRKGKSAPKPGAKMGNIKSSAYAASSSFSVFFFWVWSICIVRFLKLRS